MHIHKMKPDLTFNVAQLLREEIGGRRQYTFSEQALPLDDTTLLCDVEGSARFTRTASGVLADVKATGRIETPCSRCLTPTMQTIAVRFRDEFHSRIEVTTGSALPEPPEEDPFYIDELHMVDLGEAIRGYALMEMPMQSLCKPDCKGLCPTCGADRNTSACACQNDETDERFAVLRALLRN